MAVLKKELTLLHALAFVAGGIIGSGIFLTPNVVFNDVGSPAMLFIVFIVTGLWSLGAQLSYAELGTLIPVSGGEYAFFKHTFSSSLPAFMFAWASAVVIRPISLSILALTFSRYLLVALLGDCEPPGWTFKVIAMAIIVFVCVLNCLDVKWLAQLQSVLFGIKLVSMAFIITMGFVALGQKRQTYLAEGFNGTTTDVTSIGLAFYASQWAYAGWNDANYFVAELEDPMILVKAAFLALPLVITCYVLVNVAYMAILPRHQFETSTAVAMDAGVVMIGTAARILFPLIVAISCLGTANAVVLSSSRLVYEAGRRGDFPSIMGMVHNKLLTPCVAIVVQCAVSLFYVALIDVKLLVVLIAFSADLVFGTSMVVLMLLRRREPHSKRGIKVPLVIPVLVLLPCLVFTAVPFIRYPLKTSITAVILLSAVPIYFALVSRRFGKRIHPYLDRASKWSVATMQRFSDMSVAASDHVALTH